mmetsp:Transcript_44299/g.117095  ORF Transcript_44299/g.117095 Transcript_44299/m.117095 type:complete len:207 (+) Transcript_44299:515-1135(+)
MLIQACRTFDSSNGAALSPISFSMVSCFFWLSLSILLIFTKCVQLWKLPPRLAPVQELMSLATVSCFSFPALRSARSSWQYFTHSPKTRALRVRLSPCAMMLTSFLPARSFSLIVVITLLQVPKYFWSSISALPAVIRLAIFARTAFSLTFCACLCHSLTHVVSSMVSCPVAMRLINLSFWTESCFASFATFTIFCHPLTQLMRII